MNDLDVRHGLVTLEFVGGRLGRGFGSLSAACEQYKEDERDQGGKTEVSAQNKGANLGHRERCPAAGLGENSFEFRVSTFKRKGEEDRTKRITGERG
jgi:hypothetical protein